MYDNYAVYVKNADKSYGKNQVLKKFCMKVERGIIYGLLGSSGCGKTTLLSSIVGRRKIDRGELWVFGEKGGVTCGSTVGYMPQETALVAEFTVKDAIYYFGRIFNMPGKLLSNRYHEIRSLLDLPPGDRYIKNCSGGEQRRVSFAVALIHKPELLILDEPSVGADPIIRDRIWSYLKEICAQEKTTVVITTHYIEEARQAHMIGLVREGRLLVEEDPTTLLQRYNLETLEEVYLYLSQKQEQQELEEGINLAPIEEASQSNESTAGYNKTTSFVGHSVDSLDLNLNESTHGSRDVLSEKKKKPNRYFSLNRMSAVMDKNWKQFYRNTMGSIFLILTPFTQMLLCLISTGGDIKNTHLAIVNDETRTISCPQNQTILVAEDWKCNMTDVSCRFLDYLDDPMIVKVQYNSVAEAKQDVKKGRVTGVMHIVHNFSTSIEKKLNDELDLDAEVYNEIRVWLDMSNHQIGGTLKKKLVDRYLKFQESVMTDCDWPGQVGNPPIRVKEYMFGKENDPFIIFMTPGLIIIIIYFFGTMMTSTLIITEKCEGIWDRSIVAGVTSLELTLSHFILQGLLMVIMVLEVMTVVYGIYSHEFVGSLWNIFLVIYLQGVCGLMCGYWVSVVSTSHVMANIIITFISNTVTLCSGVFWPIEAMPIGLRIFSQCMPFTLPIQSLRNIVSKGDGLKNSQVLNGVGVMTFWTIFLAVVSIYLIKVQR